MLVKDFFLKFVVTRCGSRRRFFCFSFFLFWSPRCFTPISPLTRPQLYFPPFQKSVKKINTSQLPTELGFAVCPLFEFVLLIFSFLISCITRANFQNQSFLAHKWLDLAANNISTLIGICLYGWHMRCPVPWVRENPAEPPLSYGLRHLARIMRELRIRRFETLAFQVGSV